MTFDAGSQVEFVANLMKNASGCFSSSAICWLVLCFYELLHCTPRLDPVSSAADEFGPKLLAAARYLEFLGLLFMTEMIGQIVLILLLRLVCYEINFFVFRFNNGKHKMVNNWHLFIETG